MQIPNLGVFKTTATGKIHATYNKSSKQNRVFGYTPTFQIEFHFLTTNRPEPLYTYYKGPHET